ncbi:protein-disulfide reductase DsbD family protein [Temperatibacter marinus]|uniref:Protein-disulfide reductase DsbD family protein n=1 Tax=Temperatibacter marinus TaxID=1456591 RepID=A0AA52H9M5_9PROT|nr:protein-disulfide reductase DsbD domain-containing protein [Temperatibacter marinus]WND02677.1 protein-disulfide reductase DsbD family protein [Temperatibacter marinus]
MNKIIIFFVGLCVISTATHAKETEWVSHGQEAKTRLIGTKPVAGNAGLVWLAWEAELQNGWKTYWRSPGEAGLPVIVKINDVEKELAYPIPERFELFGLQTYGYSKKVIIPFQIEAEALKRGDTEIHVSFMVCKDICIPIEHTFQPPQKDKFDYDLKIASWLSKVPMTSLEESKFKVMSHKIIGPVGKQRVIIDVKGLEAYQQADLLIEGPATMMFIPAGKTSKGDFVRFVVKTSGMGDIPDLKNEKLRITVIDGNGKAIDVSR